MMNANAARTLLSRVATEAPDRWPAAVQSILVGTLEVLDQLVPLIEELSKGHIVEGAAPAAGPGPAPAPAANLDPDEAARRASLSPEELEREAMMDAAIAAAEVPQPAPAPKRGRKPQAPPVP